MLDGRGIGIRNLEEEDGERGWGEGGVLGVRISEGVLTYLLVLAVRGSIEGSFTFCVPYTYIDT